VGYLPPEAAAAEGRYSPVLTPRSLELVNLFNHLTEEEQDLEIEVLRLRERHGTRKQSRAEQPGASAEHANTPENGSPASENRPEQEPEPSFDRLNG
jgi:hypothetical protein